MQCPACSHDNDDDARFCSRCGTQLARQCANCASDLAPQDRFCSQCGTPVAAGSSAPAPTATGAPDVAEAELTRYVPEELLRKIRAARSGNAMRGERRTVTMLFADIQGSTSAAEHLDPEEWADIMNGAFGHLIAPVYRYEGTLARLQGDAILAFFGAPIAHEDDPDRAVRAGLDILEEIQPYRAEVADRFGVSIDVRVGINTGLVVVGEVGSDLRVEYTALGDAINVAARMEQTAEPGTVRATRTTADLLGPEVDVEVLGPVDVKGKSDPVTAVRIVGLAAPTAQLRPTAPLVGRRREQASIEAALDRSLTGIGSVVMLVGEAGIGKSRLLTAMAEAASTRTTVAAAATAPGGLGWVRGTSRSYDRAVPFGLFVDLLSQWWGGAPDRDDCFSRIAAAWELATGRDDLDSVGFLAALVGASLPAAQARLVDGVSAPVRLQRTTEAVVTYLTAEARRRPLVVVLDDVHWADAMSLALVEDLMRATEQAAMCLVSVMRPVRDQAPWRLTEAAKRDHGHRATIIELTALDEHAIDRLLAELLPDGPVDPTLRRDILERANGNPLFVEELVRSLGDAPTDAGPAVPKVHVPASLTGLLTARLDGLGEGARHVAQVASIIGREFARSTLAEVVEHDGELLEPLAELLQRGILEERGGGGDATYAFRHPLIRETAYSTVLRKTRRRLHGRIGDHLATTVPDAVEQIAAHYVEAGADEQAFPFLVAAGQRAVRAMALSDAFEAFTRALDLLPADADAELVLAAHSGLGEAYSLVPDLTGAAATYQSLLDYGRNSDRPEIQVAALNRLGFSTAALAGDFDGAMGYLGEARRLAEDSGDDLGLAEYHMNACFIRSMQGDVSAAAEHDEQTARIGAEAGDESLRLTGLLRRSLNLVVTLRFDDAVAAYEQAVELADTLGSEDDGAVLRVVVDGFVRLRGGDLAGATEVIRANLPTVDRYSSYYGATCHSMLALSSMLTGDVETELTAYASMERYGEVVGYPWPRAAAQAGRARVFAELGMEVAPELVDDAIEGVVQPTGEFYSTTIWLDLAQAALAAGDLGTAEERLRVAVDGSSAMARWERPRQQFGLTRVALARGRRDDARTALEDGRDWIMAHGLGLHEPELLFLDGAVAAAEGRTDDAGTLLQQAVATALEIGRRPVALEALGGLAELRAAAGDSAAAEGLRTRAGSLGRELAGLAADPALQAALRSRARAVGSGGRADRGP